MATQVELTAAHVRLADRAVTAALPRMGSLWRDECVGAACEALAKAARTWTPDLGCQFEGYAWPRMRTAAIDEWRRRFGKDPAGRRRTIEMVPLDPSYEPGDPDTFDEQIVELSVLHDRIGGLDDRAREILWRYYVAEETQKQIGACLGIDHSRVSQLRAATIRTLAEAI